jgi:NAD(P)-dependent dehydrogenase (short-subunit alcohol dehydrogenase family)
MNTLPVEFIEPEDVSAAVAFLASDDAKHITGLQLKVDAGTVGR